MSVDHHFKKVEIDNQGTGNVLLDNINSDFCKVLKTGTMCPNEAGLGATGGDEYTFTSKYFCSYKYPVKFGQTDELQRKHTMMPIYTG
jgi:hypothetical protein